MEPAPEVLQTLAALYARSRAGKTGQAARDWQMAYEDLLKAAGCDRGEERVCAERDLVEAHGRGLLTIERHFRTDLPLTVRFSPAQEAELFQAIGQLSPGDLRRDFSELFRAAADADCGARWREAWRVFCEDAAASAREGRPVASFSRDDPDGARELLALLPRLLTWEGESLRRFASSRLCGDSKRLDALKARAEACLRQITGGEVSSLEKLGIFENERAVVLHGPLVLEFSNGCLDLGLLTAPVRIDRRDLRRARMATCARQCFTVENLSVLHELARKESGCLLASSGSEGGFAHSAIVEFLQALPPHIQCVHCGDTDPKGFEILSDLRRRTGREIFSAGMTFDDAFSGPPLTERDRKTIVLLKESSFLTDAEKSELRCIESAGHKGRFEQEARPLVF